MPLHDHHGVDGGGLAVRQVRTFLLDLADFVVREDLDQGGFCHEVLLYRSTSAMTKSMLAMMAIRSAIMKPRLISGICCKAGNDGVRTRVR